MVSVQADCTPADALALMARRAQQSGSKVEEIAQAVVDRRVRFEPVPAE
jgi:hypothetical protein